MPAEHAACTWAIVVDGRMIIGDHRSLPLDTRAIHRQLFHPTDYTFVARTGSDPVAPGRIRVRGDTERRRTVPERRPLRGSDVGPTPRREIPMKWVVAALTVVLLAAAGIWFATSIGWNDGGPAGTERPYERPGCDRVPRPAALRPGDRRRPDRAVRLETATRRRPVVVHHRWFHPDLHPRRRRRSQRADQRDSVCGTP